MRLVKKVGVQVEMSIEEAIAIGRFLGNMPHSYISELVEEENQKNTTDEAVLNFYVAVKELFV